MRDRESGINSCYIMLHKFFHVFHGNHFTFWAFSYPVPRLHLCRLNQNEIHIWLHYLHWIYLSLLFAKIWICFTLIVFFFLGFLENEKNNAYFNLSLVIHFVLRAFAVRQTAVVTTATSFGFFRSFPCFVWSFCCW